MMMMGAVLLSALIAASIYSLNIMPYTQCSHGSKSFIHISLSLFHLTLRLRNEDAAVIYWLACGGRLYDTVNKKSS